MYKEVESVARDVMVAELNAVDPLGLLMTSFHYDDFDG
jgi:hypothetical protein